jgi:2-polyprenyl-6-methoxyphenol hydroxylase-like FAD-dependent oxidoreductase
MGQSRDVVIVGGGVAGSALAAVLARRGLPVTLLERELVPIDRVRGEYAPPWGVAELKRLELLDCLVSAGGIFAVRNVPYDENSPGDAALSLARDLSKVLPGIPGSFCMSHPAMCLALAAEAERCGAQVLKGVDHIEVQPGSPPAISFTHAGNSHEWRPNLVIGADGRNSAVRRMAGIDLLSDPPHHLIGGMLVDGVSEWPEDTQVIGNEGKSFFLIFPQRGHRVRLYLCYDFADKARFQGADRREKVLATFGALSCLPYAGELARARPIGPFNAFSNEDHWSEDPRAPGIVLIGDAAGYNDPISGQGLSIAFRDVRLVSEALLDGATDGASFTDYVRERSERMRRLRIAARLVSTLRAEFGEAARLRRIAVGRKITVDKMLTPALATTAGPEMLPPEAFERRTIEALLAV